MADWSIEHSLSLSALSRRLLLLLALCLSPSLSLFLFHHRVAPFLSPLRFNLRESFYPTPATLSILGHYDPDTSP